MNWIARLGRRAWYVVRQLPLQKTPIAFRLILGLVGSILLGTLLLLMPGMSNGHSLTPLEALFTAVSALTVTGLSIITPAKDLSIAGQVLLMLLVQTGGIGFMVGVVLILRMLGRRVSMIDRLALVNSLRLGQVGSAVQLTWAMLRLAVIIETSGALLLFLNWRERLGTAQAAFYAIFHAVSGFCNAGFDLFSGLDEFPEGIPKDPVTLLVFSGLIFLGGLGIPVIYELMHWRGKERLSLHTRLTLVLVICLVIGGAAGFLIVERLPGGLLTEFGLGEALLRSVFQSISARTAGLTAIANFELLSPGSQLLMITLMFIGSAPASMGGGITTGTLAALLLGVWGVVRGEAHVQISGRRVAEFTVRRAAAVLLVSLAAVLGATWLILVSHPTSLDQALFEVVSAFATCGLSLAFTMQLNPFGLVIIMIMMFWGRLGALTLMIAFARQDKGALVLYPEEQILIG